MNNVSKLLAASSLLILAACDSDDNDPAPAEPPAPTTTVQVLHASPDAPAVNVLVNGEEALGNVDYKDSSGWISLDAGT